VKNLIVILGFSISRQVLHFCTCNIVSADRANRALSAETKFHIQKYDGLENIENPSRALEIILGSSTDTNLGHKYLFLNSIFSESSWPLIFFSTVFSISVTRATQNSRQN
jgi:hypothetical protein